MKEDRNNLKDSYRRHVWKYSTVGMFLIYLGTKVHSPRLKGSLVIITKRKAIYKFHAVAMLSFYIYKGTTRTKVVHFLNSTAK